MTSPEPTEPVFVISVVAQLTGVHPQTLRQYDRLGLVNPARTSGRLRLYSQRDLELLAHILDLLNEGVNLAGVARILELERALFGDPIPDATLTTRPENTDTKSQNHKSPPRGKAPKTP